jgi:hypothetical protein
LTAVAGAGRVAAGLPTGLVSQALPHRIRVVVDPEVVRVIVRVDPRGSRTIGFPAIAILGASVNRCHYVLPGEHGAMALLDLETRGRPLGWPLIHVDHLPAEYGPGWPLCS